MLHTIILFTIVIPIGTFDAWLYETGRETISTRVRDFSQARPWMPPLMLVAFLVASVAMASNEPWQPALSGWLNGGLACGLWVHWFTYKH